MAESSGAEGSWRVITIGCAVIVTFIMSVLLMIQAFQIDALEKQSQQQTQQLEAMTKRMLTVETEIKGLRHTFEMEMRRIRPLPPKNGNPSGATP